MHLLAGLTSPQLEAKAVVAFSSGSRIAAGCQEPGCLANDTAETTERKQREAELPASRPQSDSGIRPGGPIDEGQTCRLCQGLPARCHRSPAPGIPAPPAQGRRLES